MMNQKTDIKLADPARPAYRKTCLMSVLMAALGALVAVAIFIFGIWLILRYGQPLGLTGLAHAKALAGEPVIIQATDTAPQDRLRLGPTLTPFPAGSPGDPGAALASPGAPTVIYTVAMPYVAVSQIDPAAQAAVIPTAVPPAPTPAPTPLPKDWTQWPTLPSVSAHARQIYQQGLAAGTNPHVFSIVGDCQSMPNLFLGEYEGKHFAAGDKNQPLQETINNFAGSFGRADVTTIDAANAASILTPMWAHQNSCGSNESPLDCELRVYRPSIVFIAIGTHWTAKNPQYLRRIMAAIIQSGAVPIVATKADNLEHDHRINADLVQAAMDYDVPVWNFWPVVQDLPNGGLDPVRQGGYMYLTTAGLERRRWSALQALDAVWKQLR